MLRALFLSTVLLVVSAVTPAVAPSANTNATWVSSAAANPLGTLVTISTAARAEWRCAAPLASGSGAPSGRA